MRFPQDLREVWRRLQGAVDSEALRVREVQEELAALDAADEAPSPWDTVAATRAHELASWLALAPEIQATRERIRGLQIQIDDEKQRFLWKKNIRYTIGFIAFFKWFVWLK
jgi:hypothetical protein